MQRLPGPDAEAAVDISGNGSAIAYEAACPHSARQAPKDRPDDAASVGLARPGRRSPYSAASRSREVHDRWPEKKKSEVAEDDAGAPLTPDARAWIDP